MDGKAGVRVLLDGEILEIRIETLSSCLIRRDDHSFESEMRDITQIGNSRYDGKDVYTQIPYNLTKYGPIEEWTQVK